MIKVQTSGSFFRKTTSSLVSSVFSQTIFPSMDAKTTPPELDHQNELMGQTKNKFTFFSLLQNQIKYINNDKRGTKTSFFIFVPYCFGRRTNKPISDSKIKGTCRIFFLKYTFYQQEENTYQYKIPKAVLNQNVNYQKRMQRWNQIQVI